MAYTHAALRAVAAGYAPRAQDHHAAAKERTQKQIRITNNFSPNIVNILRFCRFAHLK